LYAALLEGGKELMPLGSYGWSPKYGWINDKYGVSWQLNLPAPDHKYGDRIAASLLFTKDKAGKAEEAMNHYVSIFPESKIRFIAKYEKGEHDVEGTVKHAEFELFGQTLMALDSSLPHDFVFNEGVSLVVRCDSQEEVDEYWSKLSADPSAEQCGWLKDKFGVSWQITPSVMDTMMEQGTPEQRERVTQAFLPMKKFDIQKLTEAYEGA
jgi:predicted 3-demethylubiquinone-9 3-methyltransferase (glyoxalase superfamily)